MLALFLLLVFIHLVLLLKVFWPLRIYISIVGIAISSALAGQIMSVNKDFFTWASLFVLLFIVINFARLMYDNVDERALWPLFIRSSVVLMWLLGVLLAFYSYSDFDTFIRGLYVISLLTSSLFVGEVIKNYIKLPKKNFQQTEFSGQLPTITVAIPARNESETLINCLNSVIENNYPRLEVLVLDDCSQDKTSEIIKSYAQSGVRFIRGNEPDSSWLAKNQALENLLDEASGDYILFLDADVTLARDSLAKLIYFAINEKKHMVCINPKVNYLRMFDNFLTPILNWWELAIPRKLLNRPPVSSSCWMIYKNELKRLGGFKAVEKSVFPQMYFAKIFIKNNAYSFMPSTDELNIYTVSSKKHQISRTVRIRYPQLHKRLEVVCMTVFTQLFIFLSPFFIIIYASQHELGLYIPLTMIIFTVQIIGHILILKMTNSRFRFIQILSIPLNEALDVCLTIVSMFKYEFGKVTWKERNICFPVMNARKYSEP